MVTCPRCGREVPEDAKYCPYCGALIETPRESFEQNTSKEDIERIREKTAEYRLYTYISIAVAAVSAFIAGVVAYIYNATHDIFLTPVLFLVIIIFIYSAIMAYYYDMKQREPME
ncbi:MAG: zinc-ribbon domain-containing protein [Staphylothermus sp.]|nr:zinc-ribbon domain-containing protein [Staphylothermus sp.]